MYLATSERPNELPFDRTWRLIEAADPERIGKIDLVVPVDTVLLFAKKLGARDTKATRYLLPYYRLLP